MQLWIAEYLNAVSDFMNVQECFAGEGVLRAHADDQRRLCDLLHVVKVGINGHWENRAIQEALVQPLQDQDPISASQLNFTSGEHLFVGLAKCLQEVCINEGRKAEPQRRDIAKMNSPCHGEHFIPFSERISRVGDHYAPSIGDANTIPAAFEERKLNIYFEITNLLAERRLRKKETLSGASKVQSFRDRKYVLQEPKFKGI